jgi:hypothetical protein
MNVEDLMKLITLGKGNNNNKGVQERTKVNQAINSEK